MTTGLRQSLEEIEAAFLRVQSTAASAVGGDQATRDRSFQEVFELDNAIGKLGRRRPEFMSKMKELQLCVNDITIAMKHGSVKDVKRGISLTRRSLSSIEKELAPP